MNIRHKLAAGLAATVLALGLSVAVAPAANADYSNNTVTNRSQGWVQVQLDNGTKAWLAGFNARASNVDWVAVHAGSCVSIGVHKHCAPYGGYWVSVANNAQIFVSRIS